MCALKPKLSWRCELRWKYICFIHFGIQMRNLRICIFLLNILLHVHFTILLAIHILLVLSYSYFRFKKFSRKFSNIIFFLDFPIINVQGKICILNKALSQVSLFSLKQSVNSKPYWIWQNDNVNSIWLKMRFRCKRIVRHCIFQWLCEFWHFMFLHVWDPLHTLKH